MAYIYSTQNSYFKNNNYALGYADKISCLTVSAITNSNVTVSDLTCSGN